VTKRLPKILCIGAQKAGTSWLYENLRRNPIIWSPPFKELHFFDFKFVEESKRWARWHVRSNVRQTLKRPDTADEQKPYLHSLMEEPILNGNWYKRAFFPMPEGSVGFDATPEYCSVPEEGIVFIKKFLDDPFIVYIIRDPLQRALSQIRMNMNRKNWDFSDEAAWMEAATDPVIASRGDYRSFIPSWDRVFPNVLYLPFGAIAEDPISVLRSVEQHCDLPLGRYEGAHKRVFETVRVEAPGKVLDHLLLKVEGQMSFLKERFGAEFVRRTA
jgi:Sulfotransferase family